MSKEYSCSDFDGFLREAMVYLDGVNGTWNVKITFYCWDGELSYRFSGYATIDDAIDVMKEKVVEYMIKYGRND